MNEWMEISDLGYDHILFFHIMPVSISVVIES